MKINQDGIDLIKQFEGCYYVAYKCPSGVWTIGYGHTNGVYEGMVISKLQAENMLKSDLSKSEKYVLDNVKLQLNENQFSALVSFTFNCGVSNLKTLVSNRDLKQISDALLLYNKSKGKVLNGLVKRRKAEKELFDKPCNIKVQGVVINMSGVCKFSLNKDGEKNISNNFKVKEFRCKDGSDEILIDVDFVNNYLQKIREYFGVPVTINSAYRTSTYNSKVGGAKSSYHLKGQAFDIVVKNKTPLEVAEYAQSLNIKGIIQYNTFVHVDSRNTKYWARNDNGKVSSRVEVGF